MADTKQARMAANLTFSRAPKWQTDRMFRANVSPALGSYPWADGCNLKGDRFPFLFFKKKRLLFDRVAMP
jgi:hypothetical protein